MKFNSEKVRQIFEHELTDLLTEHNTVHWRHYGELNEKFFDLIYQEPVSAQFKTPEGKKFVWLWVVVDDCPANPEGRLLVMAPETSNQFSKYGVAKKASGKNYAQLLPRSPFDNNWEMGLESAIGKL